MTRSSPLYCAACPLARTALLVEEGSSALSYAEAQQIRDHSHPLFTVEMAINSLSGLPNTFTSRIEEFATEFEIEYTVLSAVDEGIDDFEAIRERVLANVRALSDDQKDAVDDAIERLVAKQVLKREGDTIRLR